MAVIIISDFSIEEVSYGGDLKFKFGAILGLAWRYGENFY